ncbi:MAG: hypothetical protein AMJ55_13250 [Gammaproteobacteria bacterium SG8_15]|nr:MAG: hypothetical protein AMJ55_13250 [Gammaproteobacteria bacterium SG8_15]
MTKTRSVGHLLNNANAGLARIIQRSKELRKLTNALKNMVDAPLCEHICVANIRENTLVIGTDSAIWHTRIKYLGPMILEQMRQMSGLEKLQHIEFRIQPLTGQPSATNNSTNRPDNSSCNKQTAESSGDSLQQALQNISKKVGKNPS